MTSKCNFIHTMYQPREDEYRCPGCGSSEIYVEEGPGAEEAFLCDMLHVGDILRCDDCGLEIFAGCFAEKLALRRILPSLKKVADAMRKWAIANKDLFDVKMLKDAASEIEKSSEIRRRLENEYK